MFRTSSIALALLALTACGSSGGSTKAGTDEAKNFTCPSAAAMRTATHAALPAPDQSSFKQTSILCNYIGTSGGGEVSLVVTFGTTSVDLTTAVQISSHGSDPQKVDGVGDGAYWIAPKGSDPGTLFAGFGDRLVSVSGASVATQEKAVAVAKLVGG